MGWLRPPTLQSEWLPRAIFSGFVATVMMTLAFFAAYAIAILLSDTMAPGSVLSGWIEALADNQVISLAADNLYLAMAVHAVAGLGWAVIYAYFAEPRLPGPGWLRGVLFSLVLWILSLIAFLPLVGGGFFGLDTGAGPLPTLGNLVLHLVYGLVLGVMYSPYSQQIPVEEGRLSDVDRNLTVTAQRLGSIGLVAGVVIGIIVGLVVVMSSQGSATASDLAVSRWFFFAGSVLSGGALGALIGSLVGLAMTSRP